MPVDWFALKVRSKAESFTEDALRGQSYETFLPTYTECRHYHDRIKKVQAALFPGYLFCRFDPNRRLPILMTLGVQQVISFSGIPAPVEESELDALRRAVSSNHEAKPWPYLRKGDVARIEFGALAGLEGVLIGEKGSDFLVLSVSLLQRSVAVQIDRSWVRPVQVCAGR
jgi:transcription antitermination factor NusG